MLLSDDTTLKLSGMLNIYYSHLWDHDNLQSTITHAYLDSFSINVWAGIVNGCKNRTFCLVV